MTTATVDTIQTISPQELKHLLESGRPIDLIDVRTPAEFRSVHVTAARNVPLDTLDAQALLKQRVGEQGDPIYVVCQSGARSAKACKALLEAGIKAVSVTGGTPACEQAGIPVERGKAVISLERQVRIAAGSLVLLGTILAATVSPWFLIIPGFVGCGLIFAGITDWCGMGLLLAKMPWNRCADTSCCIR
ncbi:MAG: rhodanese-like domain-containing protein [Phycisphaeraceae bacterium]